MQARIYEELIRLFGLLSRASARKKVYSQRAQRKGNQEVARLLRAISESESIQARRLFNSLRGQIDVSDRYISTVFEKEVEEIVQRYSDVLSHAQPEEDKVIIPVLSQLRAAEGRIRSLYSRKAKKVKIDKAQRYFVCPFCGYLSIDNPPESCPICGASQNAFREMG